MWLVDIDGMCSTHRRGEHKEIHDFMGYLRSGSMKKLHYHFHSGQLFPQLAVQRHDALESYCGWDSPLDVPYVLDDMPVINVSAHLIEHNEEVLTRKGCDCDFR